MGIMLAAETAVSGALEPMANASDAVISGLTTVGTKLGTMITTLTPIALGVAGAVIVVTFGKRVFTKLIKG